MKQIILEEVLQQVMNDKNWKDDNFVDSSNLQIHFFIRDVMYETCKQVLELAAQKAKVKLTDTAVGHDYEFTNTICLPDRESIRNTIKQVVK